MRSSRLLNANVDRGRYVMVQTQLPSAFRDLYAEVRQGLPTRDAHRPGSRLRLLPPTLKVVADQSRTSGPLNALSA